MLQLQHQHMQHRPLGRRLPLRKSYVAIAIVFLSILSFLICDVYPKLHAVQFDDIFGKPLINSSTSGRKSLKDGNYSIHHQFNETSALFPIRKHILSHGKIDIFRTPPRDEICTAELLLEECYASGDATAATKDTSIIDSITTAAQVRTRAVANQWQFSNETGEWRWRISDRGKRACGGLSFVMPLQSTPQDIYKTLQNKWLLMIGDSSVRMLHDYLVGRWLGEYTHWPSQLDNHGPPEHTVPCQDLYGKMLKGIPYAPPECTYDVFWGGARVTFLWFGLDLSPEALPKLLQSTVGSPDLVVAQHGYWEESSGRDPSIVAQTAPQKITAMLDHLEMESVYTQAYTQSQQKRVWMSLFHSVYGPYDGSMEAKDLGWEIFDRTKLTGFDGKEVVGPHPMDEVLELELELLLVLIHKTQARNEAMYRIGA